MAKSGKLCATARTRTKVLVHTFIKEDGKKKIAQEMYIWKVIYSGKNKKKIYIYTIIQI